MMKIKKELILIVMIIFLCQNDAFCVPEIEYTLRPPSQFNKVTKAFIKERGAKDFSTQDRFMTLSEPIRRDNDDFFGIERYRYLKNVNIGTLPKPLKDRAHLYPWPVDMTNTKVHIVGLYGDPHLVRPQMESDVGERHLAIDIQAHPGTEVTAVEDGFVVFVKRFDQGGGWDSRAFSFADVWVYSPASKLLWLYVHLDKNSIPHRLLKHHWFCSSETDESFKVKAGKDVIGKVNMWHTKDALQGIDIPAKVEGEYGKSYSHLHLEVRYVGDDLYTGFGVDNLKSINPLQLLIPLYKLPQKSFPSKAIMINL